ncbi:BTAD domain-containing putative transcriptional regulator [Streptomyces sp. NPDC058299]|uniref:AfsR/SARP family transcriptional regulator n=1 Tax=Streptomyces sp. NPDC058299 TaxID=3346435 RepID=UPI0036E4EFFF
MAGDVRIRLLGGFDVAVGDRPVAAGAWRLRKARSLLKVLCLAPGHQMHRERLYDLLWPDLERRAAANNLHQVLYAARRALTGAGAAGDVVVLRDDLVLLGPDGGVAIDVDEFEEAARRASRDGAAAPLAAALALAEPGLLPEDRYEPWAREAADALGARCAAIRWGLAEALRREDRTAEAIEVLRTLLDADPLHEPGSRALMTALAAGGRRREALACTRGCGTRCAATAAPIRTRGRATSTARCWPAPSSSGRRNGPYPGTICRRRRAPSSAGSVRRPRSRHCSGGPGC